MGIRILYIEFNIQIYAIHFSLKLPNQLPPAHLAPIEMKILLRFFCAKDCNVKRELLLGFVQLLIASYPSPYPGGE